MLLVYVCRGGVAERDAALVGDDDDSQAGLIELDDGLGNSGKRLEAGPGRDVTAFGELAVEDSVTIDEYGAQGAGA